ncbi:unnamed protein product [Phytophthora lilii]|uniref:Unnamed protein product n=1 Tax=Phytophthora lilii TaxID=2077276 RepID=A0A9W6U5Y6_9STRA|nr:unnamed protein product [Phytophthora lilii]
MASIYFYYNELLQQSANQAVSSGKNDYFARRSDAVAANLQQQEAGTKKTSDKKNQRSSSDLAKVKTENQDDDGATMAPFRLQVDTEATLAALQPRMNRLAYLQTAGATNLDALARSPGPKL